MSKKSFRVDRRTFLAGLGLGAGGLLLPSLDWARGEPISSAYADDSIPKRFVIYWTQHGVPRSRWKMDLPGLPAGADGEVPLADFDEAMWSPILQPLHRHRAKLNVVEGLALTSAIADEPGNNHWIAQAHLWTGARFRIDGRPRPAAKSIDQRIADAVRRDDRFASLELGTLRGGISTGDDGAVLPVQQSPRRAFDQLFPADVMVGAEPSADDLVRMERQSVLDFAQNEYDQVAPRLGGEDRRKLEQHRDMIRDLERRVGSLATVSCERPTLAEEDSRFEQFARLTTAAFACDLTRVVSLQMRQLPTDEFGAPAGTDVHQDYAHKAKDDDAVRNLAEETDGDRTQRMDAIRWMTEYYRHHAGQFATLLDQLDAVPEGSGTMLDNTLVVWMTELATGHHSLHDIPVVMAGGCKGHFPTGRYLRYAQNRPGPYRPSWGRVEHVGPSHSQLLISFAQAMGADLNALPMASVDAHEGGTIDLSGPLPGLTG